MYQLIDVDHLHLTLAQVLEFQILDAEERLEESIERARRYLRTGEESES